MKRAPLWLLAVVACLGAGGFAPGKTPLRSNPAPGNVVDPVAAFDRAFDKTDNPAALAALEAAPAAPGGLDRIDPYRLLKLRKNLAEPGLKARLAAALDRVAYRPADAMACPDDLWFEHAVGAIDTQPAVAERALLRLCDPFYIIGVRLDRRFGGIVARHPAFFDPRPAAERQVAANNAYAKRHPDLAEPLLSIALYESMLGRDATGLRRLDAVIARGEAWSDWVGEEDSALQFRAIILSGLGRWDDALVDWRASSFDEDGERNEYQVAAYAKALTGLGRPAEALPLLEGLQPGIPYFAVDAEEARVCALHALGRAAEARRLFETLPARRGDNPTAILRALICQEDEEALAAEAILWLNDPLLRGQMLIHLSVWNSPKSMSPAQAKRIALHRRLAARADVQAVIARVGRTERIDLVY